LREGDVVPRAAIGRFALTERAPEQVELLS
jgi:hypothetical protein